MIHGLGKLTQFCVSLIALRSQNVSFQRLSVFKSIFVPIHTCGHESWVTTDRMLTQLQAPEMGFLRRLHGVTLGRTEARWRPGKETSLAPPFSNLRSFGSKYTVLKKKLQHFWNFSAPPSESAPRVFCPPCPSRYAPGGMTLHHKMHSCEICRVLNVEPLLRIQRSQLR